ncbi:rubrerythrin family protein [Candidatus Contubernalis alkaliaceticus]|uniref:rubrerythrin family protein n=1 Tax=Candidatus Contubernalis alkaliaceticus TaxID=338645 RepID=UPI001F4C07AF|nr:rubrerythrin family protein [Candidatus Contubernalis alkalaceticus]UNC93674.1 rubrerythrin family protein [Candidatus Contubernalis alkalaceticus]
MKTIENLLAAFAGESQANRKYLAFAKKAEKEGFKNIARIFTAIAEAETSHALKHFETAGKVGSTLENMKTAVDGENYEVTEMYPAFIETAKAEGQDKALKSFEYAIEAEKVHHQTLQELKTLVEQGNDMEDKQIFMCPICGWVGTDPAPEKCPICNAKSKVFKAY